MGNPVVWFEIYVQDMDRAKAFYETVLATTLQTMSPPDGELMMLGFPSEPVLNCWMITVKRWTEVNNHRENHLCA